MKVIDNYLKEDLCKEIYCILLNQFKLKDYRSICIYDSDKDMNDSFGLKNILNKINFSNNNEPRNAFETNLIINSFQKNCRCLGPSQNPRYTKFFYMLCPKPLTGGALCKIKNYWEPGDIELDFDKVDFKNNRFIEFNTYDQIFMEQIHECETPAVYFSEVKDEGE
jgi:hypothetical protein